MVHVSSSVSSTEHVEHQLCCKVIRMKRREEKRREEKRREEKRREEKRREEKRRGEIIDIIQRKGNQG